MAGIFISYRRDDSAASAGRLYDRLAHHFGKEQVFRDLDAIAPGAEFAKVIEERISVSTSCLRTHSFNVCGTHPILGAMDSMAAHREEYSPRCSSTMRTARSRTSGENLFDFFMAPFIWTPPVLQGTSSWSDVTGTVRSFISGLVAADPSAAGHYGFR
ncbi:hypothetical protein SAMN05216428_101271 [Nitrosospira sp. Nsp11]|nr:hypothetical protein SAMN05216428_101271 [Nitrosospira sp. Nsp11]